MEKLCTNDLLILDEHDSHLLAVQDGEGWRLLPIETPAIHKWWRESLLVNRAAKEQWGLSITTLRCASLYQNAKGCRTAIFVGEPREWSGKQLKPANGAAWLERDEAVKVQWAIPEHAQAVQEWADGVEMRNSAALMPWTQRGWFTEASAEMEAQLRRCGLPATGPVEQVRNHGCYSCLLRAPTAQGPIYLKASPPMYTHEPPLTQLVADDYPGFAPQVYAIDRERRWTLMEGFEGRRLIELPDRARYIALWKDILIRFGQMQLDYAARTDHLRALGCPDWGLERLAAAIEPFVGRVLAQRIIAEQLAEVERERLAQAIPWMQGLCARLDEYRLPPALHHGDFHSANILSDGASYRVIDWAFQAGVTHPFFFMSVVFEEHRDPAVQRQLRDHYLQTWTEYKTMERLVEAFGLAQRLALLHAAMGHEIQLGNAQTPWEQWQELDALLYYLREIARQGRA